MSSPVARPVRQRDPERRERILAAASTLISDRGYHAVTMADIGAAAGIVGSGVYRHFNGKLALLSALLERVMLRLLAETEAALEAAPSGPPALAALVRGQVDFMLADGGLVMLYRRELLALPETHRRRLRRMQRGYVELWVRLLVDVRPSLPDSEARTLVHAAISAIQSVGDYSPRLPRERLADVLADAAHAVLGVPAP